MDKEDILELYLNEIFLGAELLRRHRRGADLLQQAADGADRRARPPTSRRCRSGRATCTRSRDHEDADRAAQLRAAADGRGRLHRRRRSPRPRRRAAADRAGRATIESFRAALPPRDYFTDEIRRQLVRELRRGGVLLAAACRSARRWTPSCRWRPRTRSSAALENFDRGPGPLARHRATLPRRGPGGRGVLARRRWPRPRSPRDITLSGPGIPAVVLEVGEQRDAARHRGRRTPRRRSCRATTSTGSPGSFADNFDARRRGAGAHDDADDDGGFLRWTLRQVPEVQGAFMAMDVNTGRVLAMQGGFSLPVLGLQPRDAGAAAARLGLQALRLRGGARFGLHARDHRRGRPHRDRHARRASGGRRTPRANTTARRRCGPASSSRGT